MRVASEGDGKAIPMYAVVMAGGSGTRFWPLSRKARPKQFLTIVGEQPMIQATCERVSTLVTDDHLVLVVGREHEAETRSLFAGRPVHVLVEPVGRNTAPCIGLAALYLQRLGCREPVAILPADHYIADADTFCRGLTRAERLAAEGSIAILGIVPTRPETGYGYIEREQGEPENGTFRVARFVEKPAMEEAMKFLKSGRFYWNAGIFVATPRALLAEFAAHMPEFRHGLDQLGPIDAPDFPAQLDQLYRGTQSISFDYAVMENPLHQVYVVPADCGWSDVGSWYSLYEVRHNTEQDEAGNVHQGRALSLDCRDCLVLNQSRGMVVTLGLKKILVVNSEDALLVADLERSQEVKRITGLLAESDSADLL